MSEMSEMPFDWVEAECLGGGPRDGERARVVRLKNQPPGAIMALSDPRWFTKGWYGEYLLDETVSPPVFRWNVIVENFEAE